MFKFLFAVRLFSNVSFHKGEGRHTVQSQYFFMFLLIYVFIFLEYFFLNKIGIQKYSHCNLITHTVDA